MNNIIVYDNYEIEFNKYPRINTDKCNTDIIIIIFLMHENFLKKLASSYEEALKYYNDCKEYYYTFKFNNNIKQYSAINIIDIIKNKNIYLSKIDKLYYYYIKNKDFYINLYDTMENAKRAYFEGRSYTYRIIPPIDFYNNIKPNVYSAIELMEINAYAQYLIQNKIIKELPIYI